MKRRSRKSGLFTIDPSRRFLEDLAKGLLKHFPVAETLVILPTRRAIPSLCRHLASAAGALILPTIKTLGSSEGDPEDNEPAPGVMSPLEQELLLARAMATATDLSRGAMSSPIGLSRGLSLATSLARLLNELEMSGISPQVLKERIGDDVILARHWERTPAFLHTQLVRWQKRLRQEKRLSPIKGQERLFARWLETAQNTPVVVAGSTGSHPHVARFLRALAKAPFGVVVLPGLDQELDERIWQALGPSHPQYALKKLLDKIPRSQVRPWLLRARRPKRQTLLRAALLRAALLGATPLPPQVMAQRPQQHTDAHLHVLTLPGLREEAQTIALILREVLQTPGRTGALVTSDRTLGRLVALELERWGIRIDDSAGTPLSLTPTGVFLRLIPQAAQEVGQEAGGGEPALLSLLKHPFTHLKFPRHHILQTTRQAEMSLRQNTALPACWDQLRAAAHTALTPLGNLLARTGQVSFSTLLETHQQCASVFAETPQGDKPLWTGEAGEAAEMFFTTLKPHQASVRSTDYRSLMARLLGRQKVWLPRHTHPRVFIWGPLEARLQSVDVMVLGGLNEGSWPPKIPFDPWLNRALRHRLGLEASERFLGLAAHDFAQLACAPKVVITRAQKVQGAPTTAARWVKRLGALLQDTPQAPAQSPAQAPWHRWQEQLHAVDPQEPEGPPAPCPPAPLRPRRLSVSDVVTLLENPYLVYARRILRLTPLAPLRTEPSPQARGLLIHQILHAFAQQFPKGLPAPQQAFESLLTLSAEFFAPLPPIVKGLWQPRFEDSARWLLEQEWRKGIQEIHGEVSGTLRIPVAGGFEIRGRADRIDIFPEGRWGLYDYKTGGTLSQKNFPPQLLLLALMAYEGTFKGLPAAQRLEVAYILLKGKKSQVVRLNETQTHKATRAWRGELETLLASFADPGHPYPYTPAQPPHQNDPFAHLARQPQTQ